MIVARCVHDVYIIFILFKNRKLFRIIASEEDKFWKFISSNKLLNQERINLDVRLLVNYYRNKG